MANDKKAQDQVVDDSKQQASDTYKKLPDNPDNTGDSVSTADDTANSKYSHTNIRKEDKDLDSVRGKQ
jgi:hypothetical protein